jgi:hypothetical protein
MNMHMTILKHLIPVLGLATFIHAQDAVENNQDFPIEETTTPVVEEAGEPAIVEAEAPAPTPKKRKAKVQPQEAQQMPQQAYISNELEPVPVSKSVMLLTLNEDDPSDPADPRDNGDMPKKKEEQTSGGLFGFGFLADDSAADESGESGSSKKMSFKFGLHVDIGWLAAKADLLSEDYRYYRFEDSYMSTESEYGVAFALKNIVADMFVSTGLYIGSSYMLFKCYDIDEYYYYEETFQRLRINADVPITAGYQFMKFVNVEAGIQLSYTITELDHIENHWETKTPNDLSVGYTFGASAVLGQNHELGLKLKFKSNETTYALTYNYWIF